MKFQIEKDVFQDALNQVQHVVSSRTTLPILSNVLIRADELGLELSTTDLDVTITKLDKLIAREKKKVKSSELDKALNNPKLAQTAAIFGGNSAAHLSAVAASRVSLLETERAVLEAMKRPSTLQGLAMLEAELEQLRTTRRNLDNATR